MTSAAGAAPPVARFDVPVGDGLRLSGERSGDGEPVLLLHGFTGNSATWAELRSALAPRFEVIAVDLPGHGRSSAPADEARYALPRLADDLVHLLDALGRRRAAVLGYSMGGRAALRLALAHPERVRALVLESTSPGIDDPRERAARVVADRALADEIERHGIRSFVERWEKLPLWTSQSSLAEPARARLRVQRLANDPRGLANSLRGAGAGVEAAALDVLSSLDVPTLVVAGALDAKYTVLAQAMCARLPRARLEVLEGAGHTVHLERPAAFAALVQEFLGAQG